MNREKNSFGTGSAKGFELLCNRMVLVLGILAFLPLVYYSMCYTERFIEGTEIMQTLRDSVAANLIGLLLFAMILAALRVLMSHMGDRRKLLVRIFKIATLVYAAIVCIVCVAIVPEQPYADADILCQVAALLKEGDYSTMNPPGYMSYNPHQFGLIFVLQILYGIFGQGNYVAFEYLNALCIPLLVYAGYKILELISENEVVLIFYCVMMSACLPLFLYVLHVYGEVSSTTFCMVLMWQTLRYCKGRSQWSVLWMILSAVFANMTRMNSMIVVIAVAIVLGIHGITNRRLQVIVVIAGLFLSVFAVNEGIKKYYEMQTGIEVRKGIPHASYIMMGLQDTPAGPGWFNGTNYAELQKYNYEYEPTQKAAMVYIGERITELWEDKAAAADFVKRKLLTQWNAPDYNVLFTTGSFTCAAEELPAMVHAVYFGNCKAGVEKFMDRYQFVLYVGLVICLMGLLFRKTPIENQLLLISMIGGFLFSIMWEAMSRYILPYMVFSIPLASMGLYQLQEAFIKGYNQIREKRG